MCNNTGLGAAAPVTRLFVFKFSLHTGHVALPSSGFGVTHAPISCSVCAFERLERGLRTKIYIATVAPTKPYVLFRGERTHFGRRDFNVSPCEKWRTGSPVSHAAFCVFFSPGVPCGAHLALRLNLSLAALNSSRKFPAPEVDGGLLRRWCWPW